MPDITYTPGEHIPPSARYDLPKMLYNMLDDCTFDEEYCKIISWQPHGLAFKVHNREELEKILPQWFREKYESFRCLLEQWGFLKLSRGKDRGCWYHEKFYYRSGSAHSRKSYENVEKEDFIEGMPTYLSPRDEPDLEKKSAKHNRISPERRKKKAMLNLLAENEAKAKRTLELSKEKVNIASVPKRHYSEASKKECRYCHGLFAAQGFKRHEEKCKLARKRKRGNESDSGGDYDADSDMDRNVLSESDDEVDDSDDGDMVKCRYCNVYFSKYGVKKHERSCMQVDREKEGQNNKKVLKQSANRNNFKRSVLSDDSSVDSIESGCRICGFDDDHANLLLCEGCDTEVHTYCLNPPLQKVPAGDWFCDTCKLRMEDAKVDLSGLVRRVPTEMAERFGEICFAKSAENAHWWPALIFDPRSFLHNREVVDLARRNLGKRYLVFFFENQDAFAAIPKTWIKTWEEGLEKEYDKGRSVRHASKGRKEQFKKAMDLANEAFEDVSGRDSDSVETDLDSLMDNDAEEQPSRNGIPRIIGGDSTSIFDLNPDFDWRSLREAVLKEVEASSPSDYPTVIDKDIGKYVTEYQTGNPKASFKAQLFYAKRVLYVGLFPDQYKAAFAVELFLKKLKSEAKALEKDDTPFAQHSAVGETEDHKNAAPGSTSEDAVGTKPVISFGTFTDNKPSRSRYRSVVRASPKTKTKNNIEHSLQQQLPKKKKRKLDRQDGKSDLQVEKLPPLLDHERDELLMNTAFCHYYIQPLSEI